MDRAPPLSRPRPCRGRLGFAAGLGLASTLMIPPTASLGQNLAAVHVATFNREYVNWNETRARTFKFPAATIAYQQVILHITLECPSGGCDPWDRSANVTIKGLDDTGHADTFEIARFITPYGMGCSWTADVTDYRPLLAGNAELAFRIETYIGGTSGWLVTLGFDFHPGSLIQRPIGVRNLWRGTPEYGNPDNPITTFFAQRSVPIPSRATAAKLRFSVTGHGQGNTDNAAEFARKVHGVLVNGADHQHDLWRSDCDQNPCSPQGGTWQFDRAGWCPGSVAEPWDVDITKIAKPGTTAAIRYHVASYVNRCRPVAGCAAADCPFGNCAYDGGGHTTPVYWVESQLITYTTERPFVRGDADGNGTVNLADAVVILFDLFGGQTAACLKAGDTNDDGTNNVSDVIFLLNYLFEGGAAPKAPFGKCGADATSDALSCVTFPRCP